MKLRLSLPLFSALSVMLFAAYGIYLAVQPSFVTYSFEGNFAPQLMQQCRCLMTPQFLQQQTKHTCLQAVKNTVIGLETCSIRNTGFQKVHVTIKGLQPCININNNLVLTVAGTTMPATELQEEVIERLPLMHVEDPTLTTPETVAQLFAFMQALPVDLFETSTVVWRDKTAIYLIDQQTGVTIVAHHATRFTPHLLQALAEIEKRMIAEPQKKSRVGRKKVIDVRVKGQVIIRYMQGGEDESTSREKYYHSY